MRAEDHREWREALGAYVLGHLGGDERAALEAHLEGCPACRAEADSLAALPPLLARANPKRIGPSPSPPPALAERVMSAVRAEQRGRRRRRRVRGGLVLASVAAAIAVALAIVLPGGGESEPEVHVNFADAPARMKMGATLIGHPYGTEVRVYVRGVRSGTLCRVSVRTTGGSTVSAGTFRYRRGGDYPTLTAAVDLSRAEALVIDAGSRRFVAPLNQPAGPA